MNIKTLVIGVAVLMIALVSCDDTTDTVGTSLINNMDNLQVKADTFGVASRSEKYGAIVSRSTVGYLGSVVDPETNTLIKSSYLVQFNTLENFQLPDKEEIMSMEDGEIVADSCELHLQYNYLDVYGDSLAQMKLTVYEMGKPMEEGVDYDIDFDPEEQGYVRSDGLQQSRSYTIADLTEEDKSRTTDQLKRIRVRLNKPYTDKDGVKYNNFGTYLLRKYYQDPSNFRNAYKFTHNVMPGFLVKITDGVGSMVYVSSTNLYVFFKTNEDGKETKANTVFSATEEVIQASSMLYDDASLQSLIEDNSCTFLKTPAAIYTELTLPVDEIIQGHENDSINTAKISIPRITNSTNTEYTLPAPTYLMMIPKDSLTTFFANNKVADNKYSFIASNLDSNGKVTSAYTFSNVSALVSMMAKAKKDGTAGENWNKVVLVPVQVTYSTDVNNTKVLTRVTHDMSLTSTRLQKGYFGADSPLQICVIYSKFYGR